MPIHHSPCGGAELHVFSSILQPMALGYLYFLFALQTAGINNDIMGATHTERRDWTIRVMSCTLKFVAGAFKVTVDALAKCVGCSVTFVVDPHIYCLFKLSCG
jgi:hypothetical protein